MSDDEDERHEGIQALDELAGFRVSELLVILSNVTVGCIAALIVWLTRGASSGWYGFWLTASMGTWSFVLLPVALVLARRDRLHRADRRPAT